MEEMTYNSRARNALLAQYLWPLFLLCIGQLIANIIVNQLGKHIQAISNVGSILQIVCMLASAYLLLKLASISLHFKQAGMTRGVLAILNLVALIISFVSNFGGGLSGILSLALMVLGLYSTYHEFMAYAEVLTGVDDVQAQKWKTLWIMNMVVIISPFLIVVLAMIPVLGLVFVVGLGIAIIAVGIMELVYLYRTAQLFRKLAQE